MALIYGRPDSERELLNKYPKAVKRIEDIDKAYEDLKKQLKKENDGFFGHFKKWRKQWQLGRFEENKDDPMHAGARGELMVLDELSKLPEDYHVLCGVEFELPYYVTYKDQKNLKSAQMDFVVVSKAGVVVIEVKNWTRQYYENNDGISPHEQVDRAGLVMWISLKSLRMLQNPRVIKVLVPIQKNMRYDPIFKFVLMRNLENINSFITNQKEVLSEKEIKIIVDMLQDHITV